MNVINKVISRLGEESDSYAKAIIEGINELEEPMEKPVEMTERETIIFRMGIKQGCDKAKGLIVIEQAKVRKKRTAGGIHLL